MGCSTAPSNEAAADQSTPSAAVTGTCESHTAVLAVQASSEQVQVGETLVITGTLQNAGCLPLGLPQYRLYNPDGDLSLFEPDRPDAVVHSLGIPPGESDQVIFKLKAVSSGESNLVLSASFEVHQGYPGPAYWGQTTSLPLSLQVLP